MYRIYLGFMTDLPKRLHGPPQADNHLLLPSIVRKVIVLHKNGRTIRTQKYVIHWENFTVMIGGSLVYNTGTRWKVCCKNRVTTRQHRVHCRRNDPTLNVVCHRSQGHSDGCHSHNQLVLFSDHYRLLRHRDTYQLLVRKTSSTSRWR